MKKKNNPDYVSLDNLGYGAAAELFGVELEKVIKNIVDPNTKATKKRKITLTLTISPDEDRRTCSTEIDCKSSLAPIKGFKSQMFVGEDHEGNALASEVKPPEQGNLFDEGPLTVRNGDGEDVDVRTGEVIPMVGRG